MKRKDIIEKLLKEGFTEKTLSLMNDKELSVLSKTMMGEAEQRVMTILDKGKPEDVAAANALMKDPTKNSEKLKNTAIAEENPTTGVKKTKKKF